LLVGAAQPQRVLYRSQRERGVLWVDGGNTDVEQVGDFGTYDLGMTR
jgi:hypothetical protein